jgi:hypothetical protein
MKYVVIFDFYFSGVFVEICIVFFLVYLWMI